MPIDRWHAARAPSRLGLGRLIASAVFGGLAASGYGSAWLGALVSIVLAAPVKASTSPTTAGDPFWIGVGVVGWTIVMSTVLAVSFGIAAVVRSRLAPRQAERVLAAAGAVLLGLGAVAGVVPGGSPPPG